MQYLYFISSFHFTKTRARRDGSTRIAPIDFPGACRGVAGRGAARASRRGSSSRRAARSSRRTGSVSPAVEQLIKPAVAAVRHPVVSPVLVFPAYSWRNNYDVELFQ